MLPLWSYAALPPVTWLALLKLNDPVLTFPDTSVLKLVPKLTEDVSSELPLFPLADSVPPCMSFWMRLRASYAALLSPAVVLLAWYRCDQGPLIRLFWYSTFPLAS